jgi:hypothetical protein
MGTTNQQLLEAVQKLAKAAQELNKIWDNANDGQHEVMSTRYPFETDFEEVVGNINNWNYALKNKMKEVK